MQQVLEQEERQVEGEGRRKEDQEEKGWSRLWCYTYCSLILRWIKYYMVLLMLITVMMKFLDFDIGSVDFDNDMFGFELGSHILNEETRHK